MCSVFLRDYGHQCVPHVASGLSASLCVFWSLCIIVSSGLPASLCVFWSLCIIVCLLVSLRQCVFWSLHHCVSSGLSASLFVPCCFWAGSRHHNSWEGFSSPFWPLEDVFPQSFSATATVALWFRCPPREREVVGSIPGRFIPKTLKLAF